MSVVTHRRVGGAGYFSVNALLASYFASVPDNAGRFLVNMVCCAIVAYMG